MHFPLNKAQPIDLPLKLASRSPARARLLTQIGVQFTIDAVDIDETPHKYEKPVDYVKRVAQEKALAAHHLDPRSFILAADTIVAIGPRILRKAGSADEARQQLRLLSGRRHRVLTAVVLCNPQGHLRQRLCQSHVAFKALDLQEIEGYVASDEWREVAVYRHNGLAGCFIRHLNGLASTIEGLPLFATYQLLKGHYCAASSPDTR